MVLNYARALLSYDERNRDAKRERWKNLVYLAIFFGHYTNRFSESFKENDQIK